MIKKSKLLSLLTATSIILTSAGTYALWDKTTTNTSAELSFRDPVTISVDNFAKPAETKATLDKDPTISGKVKFNIDGNSQGLANKLTMTPTISAAVPTSADPITIDENNFTIEIKKGELFNQPVDSTLGEFTDDIDKSATYVEYLVEVTPNVQAETPQADDIISAIANGTFTLDLTAELSYSEQ